MHKSLQIIKVKVYDDAAHFSIVERVVQFQNEFKIFCKFSKYVWIHIRLRNDRLTPKIIQLYKYYRILLTMDKYPKFSMSLAQRPYISCWIHQFSSDQWSLVGTWYFITFQQKFPIFVFVLTNWVNVDNLVH